MTQANIGKRIGFTHVDGTTTIPDEKTMHNLGFRATNGIWYYSRPVGPLQYNTSFNIEIDPETGEYGELTLDEDFGQPYYYNGMQDEIRNQYVQDIDRTVERFHRNGLTGINVDHSMYGYHREVAHA
ncbi:hypothetical protein [Bifidobacterium callitrichidarum]|uniref:Uncharacterized protein n=1 Tax=Bifidobacterium callitrichidarum TaxID=2052941 RepID=A0A2U2N932_9BIFI|nr:hypothetical protein [Bifidobacterium callitrichidarum]PWG65671.1 hypothetical protein DF196_06985 [Bifidobacterium callitrichidarum]